MKPILLKGYKLRQDDASFIKKDEKPIQKDANPLNTITPNTTTSITTTATTTTLTETPKTTTQQNETDQNAKKHKILEVMSTIGISYIFFDLVFSFIAYKNNKTLFKTLLSKITLQQVCVSLIISISIGLYFHHTFFINM